MLKKSVCIVLTAVMILSCSSCAKKAVYDYSRDNNTFKIGNTVETDVVTTSFPTDNKDEPKKLAKKVFRSYYDLEFYINPIIQEMNEKNYCNEDDREKLQQQLNKYTPEWFKNHILYYDLLMDGDGGTYVLKRAEKVKKKDGKQMFEMDVGFTYTSTIGLCQELFDNTFIEINRDDVKGISDENFVLNNLREKEWEEYLKSEDQR